MDGGVESMYARVKSEGRGEDGKRQIENLFKRCSEHACHAVQESRIEWER